MRKSGFCSVCLVFLGSTGGAIAQPVVTDFRSPVSPVDQSGANKNGYYDANLFLQLTSGRGYHSGEDWNGNKKGKGSTDYGDPVYPTAVGKVVKIFDPPLTQKHSWGKTVIVVHILPDGRKFFSLYAHLSKIDVKNGQIVYPNKPLGNIGDANGYYAGAAHLHFEMRWVNDWTPTSPGYYKTLTVANALKYLDPTLFLDDRATKVSMKLQAEKLFVGSAEGIQIPDYTPAVLSYVTCQGKTKSLFSAVMAGGIDPSFSTEEGPTSKWDIDLTGTIVFGPDIDFQIKSSQDCLFTIVVPGNNFQSSRARGDMIEAASHTSFSRVKLETLADLGVDSSSAFDLRSLCFDNGPNTAVACIIHATEIGNPLSRWILWYEPLTDEYIGDWVQRDLNDMD